MNKKITKIKNVGIVPTYKLEFDVAASCSDIDVPADKPGHLFPDRVSPMALQVPSLQNGATNEVKTLCCLVSMHHSKLHLPNLENGLMEEIADHANIAAAWKRLLKDSGQYHEAMGVQCSRKGRKGKAVGVDRQSTLEAFKEYQQNPQAISDALLSDTYMPQPVRRTMIDKPNGGQRPLGIPTVKDKAVQRAILQILDPKVDPSFSDNSFGFRCDRSVYQAAEHVLKYIGQGKRYAVDLDLSGYFDTVDHQGLLSVLSAMTDDARFLALIQRMLAAGVVVDGVLELTDAGTPQGGVLSPFLANLFLHPFDKLLESRGLCFVRYADDVVILCGSRRAANRVMQAVTRVLESYRLVVNQDKTSVVPTEELEFLGLSYRNDVIGLSVKNAVKVKERIRILTKRQSDAKVKRNMKNLRVYLKGWFAHFGIVRDPHMCQELQGWFLGRIERQLSSYNGVSLDPMAVAISIWEQSCRKFPHWRNIIANSKYSSNPHAVL